MAFLVQPVLTLAAGALFAKFAPSMGPHVGPAAVQLGELAINNPVASIAAAVATVTTTVLVRDKLRQTPNKNEAARRMSAAASKNVVRSRTSAILAHPIQHAIVSNRTTDENNAVRWKRIFRRIVGLIQLTGAILPLLLPHVALALSLSICIYSSVSFLLTFKLADHYKMNEPTSRPMISKYDDETDLNLPENRSNTLNSILFAGAALFAPISVPSLLLDALATRAKELADEAEMR